MKKDELHARVLYLYQILRHYSDSEHPLTTQQILKIMDEKYHIQIHRVSVQNYVEILNSCGIKVNQQRAQDKYYYLEDRTFDIPELMLIRMSLTRKFRLKRHNRGSRDCSAVY